MMTQTRILIAGNHNSLIIKGMRELLSSQPTWHCIGKKTRLEELEKKIELYSPNIVLIYMSKGEEYILQNIEKNQFQRQAKIVILTESLEPNKLLCLIQKGVFFIEYTETCDNIVQTISQIIEGKSVCSPRTAQLLIQRLVNQDSLTPREHEVLLLIHLKNAHVARILNISVPTVRTHICRINAKLGFNSRHEAVAYVARQKSTLQKLF